MALFLVKRESFCTHSAVYVAIKNGTIDHTFWWTSDCIFDEQIIVFLMFFGSFDYKFTRKVAKILINDGIHYSLGQSYVIIRSLSPARIVIFSSILPYFVWLFVITDSDKKIKIEIKRKKQKAENKWNRNSVNNQIIAASRVSFFVVVLIMDKYLIMNDLISSEYYRWFWQKLCWRKSTFL